MLNTTYTSCHQVSGQDPTSTLPRTKSFRTGWRPWRREIPRVFVPAVGFEREYFECHYKRYFGESAALDRAVAVDGVQGGDEGYILIVELDEGLKSILLQRMREDASRVLPPRSPPATTRTESYNISATISAPDDLDLRMTRSMPNTPLQPPWETSDDFYDLPPSANPWATEPWSESNEFLGTDRDYWNVPTTPLTINSRNRLRVPGHEGPPTLHRPRSAGQLYSPTGAYRDS